MVGVPGGRGAPRAPVMGVAIRTSAATPQTRINGIGCLHMHAHALTPGPGGPGLFIAIDRALRFVHAELHDRIDADGAAAFLRSTAETCPYRIHTAFTDRGAALADPPATHRTPGVMTGVHLLDRACWDLNIVHRRLGPRLPWTRNAAGETGRALLEALSGMMLPKDRDSIEAEVLVLVTAHNFSRPLASLGWRTPFQAVFDAWNADPSIFTANPRRLIPKPRLACPPGLPDTRSLLI